MQKSGSMLSALLGNAPPAKPVNGSASPFQLVETPKTAADPDPFSVPFALPHYGTSDDDSADEAAAQRIEAKFGKPAESEAHPFDGLEVGDEILIGEAPTPANPVPHIAFCGRVMVKTADQICIRDAAGDLRTVHKAAWRGWWASPLVHLALAVLLLLPGCAAWQPGPLGLSYDPLTGTWTGTATLIPKAGGKEPVAP